MLACILALIPSFFAIPSSPPRFPPYYHISVQQIHLQQNLSYKKNEPYKPNPSINPSRAKKKHHLKPLKEHKT
ncbi:hypothetical protein BZA77DRAFT_137044 [Pyronema omphalodes]|nr:hypothetical protein BZA77DRAFT_137044 [Pyronema omphalodes]